MFPVQRLHPLVLAALSLAACAAPPPQPQRPPARSPALAAPPRVTAPAAPDFTAPSYDSVDPTPHNARHRWTATLEADLIAEGRTVAPRGSVVYGVLSQARSAGRVAGKSSLTLRPTDLMIGSRLYPIVSGEIQAVGETGSGAKTVGRTARGAAVGGLVGGSDGAKTGAKVGLGASILSDDGQIQVSSGTLLEFPLTQPLSF